MAFTGKADRWDLLVVGGGTAGLVASQTASALGARVLLVERERTGGDCLWTGCVPSKALLAAASAAATVDGAARFGLETVPAVVRFDEVMARVRAAIETIAPVDSPEALARAGVEVVSGDVVLLGPDTASIDGRRVEFAQALLATGSAPVVPAVPGLAASRPLTSETVWDLEELPARLLVMGGGSVGCELGQAFARLGAAVTLVEAAPRLLPNEDPRASAAVRSALEADGVTVLLDRSVVRIDQDDAGARGGTAVLGDGLSIEHDVSLVAVGRRPRTEQLGLEAAGVETTHAGHVVLDARLRTSNPRIWAAGDVTEHPHFTHVAGVHGSTVAINAVLGLRRSAETVVPRVTFTDPEVATVGVSTHDAVRAGHRLLDWSHTHADRAVTEQRTDGYTTLVVDRRGRIVGGCVVAPRAGEVLAEITLAVKQGLRPRDLAGAMHAYPTYADGTWNAAIADVRRGLAAPTTARVIGGLAAARRRLRR